MKLILTIGDAILMVGAIAGTSLASVSGPIPPEDQRQTHEPKHPPVRAGSGDRDQRSDRP